MRKFKSIRSLKEKPWRNRQGVSYSPGMYILPYHRVITYLDIQSAMPESAEEPMTPNSPLSRGKDS